MKYNPLFHHRRSVRLRRYDYSWEGMYFVTICTRGRVHFFGEIENDMMQFSPFGIIACQEWEQLPERWPHVELGAFQVMPNHMHGILIVHRPFIDAGKDVFSMEKVENSDATDESAAPDLSGVPEQIHVSEEIPPFAIESPDEMLFSKLQWRHLPTLGQIIGAYKSNVWTKCLKWHQDEFPGVWLDKIWQRNYDDRIIRNAEMHQNITTYIIQNPANWKQDKFFD